MRLLTLLLPVICVLCARLALGPCVEVAGKQDPSGENAPPEEPDLLAEMAELGKLSLAELWPRLARLERASRNGSPAALSRLAEGIRGLGERARLAAAKVLLGASDAALGEKGQVEIERLARDAPSKDVRLAAIRLLGDPIPSLWQAAYLVLKDLADARGGGIDPEVRIEASLSLWRLDNYPPLREPLLDLIEEADATVRYGAALALAETGYLDPPVGSILEELRDEPSDRGKRAALLLRLGRAEPGRGPVPGPGPAPGVGITGPERPDPHEAGATPRRSPSGPGKDPAPASWSVAIEEVVARIIEHSVYRAEIRLRDLNVAALKGMVASIDEYSSFLDAEDFQQLEASQLGVYWGLGAQIIRPERGAPLLVVKSHHGGPAHRAGLRSGDRILEIHGVPTSTTSVADIKGLAAGTPGTVVHILVRPWNEAEPRSVSVVQGEVELPSIQSAFLPDGIGAIKVPRFGPGTASEFERVLDGLESRGLNALILDLRGNPGGRLEEAVKIVDLFVGEKPQPIVKETGPTGREEWFREWLPHAGEKPFHPLLVLVDGSTASSAEVVAGALQDFRRATIMGQRTFGKGAKQTSFPLSPALNRLLGGEGRILLTTSYLVLPLGRPIQAPRPSGKRTRPGAPGGIVPDIALGEAEERVDEKTEAERLRIQFHPSVNEFIARRFDGIRALHAAGTTWDPASEEGFTSIVDSLDTRLSVPEIRRCVRNAARRHAEEEDPAENVADYDEDPHLARAILEALRRLGRDPNEIPAYRDIPGRTR